MDYRYKVVAGLLLVDDGKMQAIIHARSITLTGARDASCRWGALTGGVPEINTAHHRSGRAAMVSSSGGHGHAQSARLHAPALRGRRKKGAAMRALAATWRWVEGQREQVGGVCRTQCQSHACFSQSFPAAACMAWTACSL
jgi:hypothetical protein